LEVRFFFLPYQRLDEMPKQFEQSGRMNDIERFQVLFESSKKRLNKNSEIEKKE
jgi:hypothetical protein